MAIEANSADFLVKHFLTGVKFAATACLGRQGLALQGSDLKRLIKIRGLPESCLNIRLRHDTQADWFLKTLLGAEKITSFDNSGYQQADIIHDLNEKIPDFLCNRFDAVIDGGTLEHIFNFPIAVYNCMKLLRQGGHFFSFTMVNNHMGHGFYQFSPELFFRVFCESNGFEMIEMLLIEHQYPSLHISARKKIYRVRDPVAVGKRVTLLNRKPTVLFLCARKVEEIEPFSTPPQQSDYVRSWQGENPPTIDRRKELLKRLLTRMPVVIQRLVRGHIEKYIICSINNRNFYEPVRRIL
ncbi:MAG: class I SAM-dependent methyltransferase [Candidatus Thiosymbion ectosymbiont of Robbea hypermnestra]|nr:class I SAM-dependent methyltransferase [Candidatus Thiosymbion ectosymbiont of Robbea hypermnestra]